MAHAKIISPFYRTVISAPVDIRSTEHSLAECAEQDSRDAMKIPAKKVTLFLHEAYVAVSEKPYIQLSFPKSESENGETQQCAPPSKQKIPEIHTINCPKPIVSFKYRDSSNK